MIFIGLISVARDVDQAAVTEKERRVVATNVAEEAISKEIALLAQDLDPETVKTEEDLDPDQAPALEALQEAEIGEEIAEEATLEEEIEEIEMFQEAGHLKIALAIDARAEAAPTAETAKAASLDQDLRALAQETHHLVVIADQNHLSETEVKRELMEASHHRLLQPKTTTR
jgi:hypothetical protein